MKPYAIPLVVLVVMAGSQGVLSGRELRSGGGGGGCSVKDIMIEQDAAGTLPNGIPTYTVHVVNGNPNGVGISNIHLKCGSFSSARLINPAIFRRLAIDDCLVNDGNSIASASLVEFQYADTFLYPLSVASVECH